MKHLVLVVAPFVLTPHLLAEPGKSPVDPQGNRAANSFQRRVFESTSEGASLVPAWAPFGPKGANARAVAASPTAANVRIAGVNDSFGSGGLYRSADNGNFWVQAPETGNRGINDVKFSITGKGFAATQDGLFVSTDNGETWQRVTLPGTPEDSLVQSIACDPTDGQVVWLGIGQFLNGTSTRVVLRSADGGETWADVSPPVTSGMGATVVAVDPANPARVVAAFSGNFGFGNDVWVTTDSGANWEDRSAGLPNNIIWDAAFASGTLYVCGGQDFGSQFVGLYRSANGGVDWEELSATWPSRSVTALAVTPGNPQKIFVGTQRAGLGVSTDGGANWTFSAGGTGQFPVNDVAFVPGQPDGVFLALGSVAVLRSSNGGASFQPAAAGINRLNVTSIAVNPLNSAEIAISFAGDNDGGIFKSTDAGETWTFDQNAPLPRWQYLVFGPDGTLYATHDGPLGRADDGVWVRQSNGTWTGIGPGTPSFFDNEGKAIAVSTGASPVILFGGREGFFGGQDAALWTYNREGTGLWEKSYESGTVPSEIFSGIQWLNSGAGPEAVASLINFGQEAGAAGGIFRTTDGGASWARSETGYPFGWHAWTLSSRPSEPNTLYTSASMFTFSNTGNRIFKSVDGGVNWVDQSQGLDTLPFRQMMVDPLAAGVIYAVDLNTGNVLRSIDDGATFSLFSDGLIGQGGGSSLAYGGSIRKLYYGSTTGAFATALEPAGCPADLGTTGGVPGQDGQLNNNDFVVFIDYFFAQNPLADVGGTGGVPGADGQWNNNDFVVFIDQFFAGC